MYRNYHEQTRVLRVIAGIVMGIIVFIAQKDVTIVPRLITSFGLGTAIYAFFYFDRGRRGINLAQLIAMVVIVGLMYGLLKLLGYE